MSNEYARELYIPSDLSICSLEYAVLELKKISKDTDKIVLVCHKDNFNYAYKSIHYIEKLLDCKIDIVIASYLNIDAWFIIDSIGYHLIFSSGA